MKKYRITIVLGIIFVIGILSAACAKYDNKATTAVNESSYVYDEAEAPKYDADMADFNNVTGLTSTTELVSEYSRPVYGQDYYEGKLRG